MTYLDKARYSIRAVVISHDKEFFFHDIDAANIPSMKALREPHAAGIFKGPYEARESTPVWKGCDLAFLALHGTFGEDGVVQGFLDTLEIPYTGSGVFASAVAMDKIASKYLYIHNGLDVPPYSIYGVNNPLVTIDSIIEQHGFPCFCKCPQSGSSRLMGKATDKESLRKLLHELEQSSEDILVERSIQGIEFSCGVIEYRDGRTEALPPIEIRPVSSDFFDYDAKYTDGGSHEIVPAPHPKDLLDRIEQISLKAHKILGCRGVSRTDMILENDRLYVLETNTLPGMTSNSLLPKAFKATGGTYTGLLDILIETARVKGRAVQA